MILATTPYFNISKSEMNHNFPCPVCHETIVNDYSKLWIAQINRASLLSYPVHKICVIRCLPSSKCGYYGDAFVNLKNVLSPKEKIGVVLLKNVDPIKITMAAASVGALIIGSLALASFTGAMTVAGPKAIGLVAKVLGLDAAFEVVAGTIIVIFFITVVISKVGQYLIES